MRYAASYPQFCAGLILFGTFVVDHQSAAGYLRSPPDGFEMLWKRLAETVNLQTGDDMGSAVARIVLEGSPEKAALTASEFIAYESACATCGGARVPHRPSPSPQQTVAYIAIRMHYLRNGYFPDGVTWRERVTRIGAVPTEIIHGTMDHICNVNCSIELASVLPGAKLTLVEGGTHQAFHDTNFTAIRNSIERLSARISCNS
jgi:pimeloyl-ACP methyl ester carboxylesterase